MSSNSIIDCKELELDYFSDYIRSFSVKHNIHNFPFSIKRIFYLYDVPEGESRGAHAHKECHQFLIAISGSFEVMIDDGQTKNQILLNRPNLGFHIPPGIWASEINFSEGAVCLVLASHLYDEFDYIREYEAFKEYKLSH